MKYQISKLFNKRRLFSPVLLFIAVMFLSMASCDSGGSTGPDNGGNNNGGENNGNEIGIEPTFANVQMIFSQNCGACHTSDSQNGVRLNNYDNVINSVGDQYGIEVIQPGDADGSPLVDKIESNPQFGSRMPENGPFLPSDRIDQIKEWINQGAENN